MSALLGVPAAAPKRHGAPAGGPGGQPAVHFAPAELRQDRRGQRAGEGHQRGRAQAHLRGHRAHHQSSDAVSGRAAERPGLLRGLHPGGGAQRAGGGERGCLFVFPRWLKAIGVLTSSKEGKVICQIDGWVLGGVQFGAGVGAVWGAV